MIFSRRDFCKTAVAGLAFSAAGGCKAAGCLCGAKPRAAVQLYSVRDLCAKDFVGTLKAIKEMGYVGVEFAGYYGKSAKDMKQILDDNGLIACGTHIGADDLLPERIQGLFDYANGIGNKYIVCPGGGFKQDTKEHLLEMAARFSKAAELAKPYGIHIGYHNHQSEFEKKFENNTKCAWEIFFSACSPDVYTQLDVGHCQAKGQDPLYWLDRFPGRALTVHIKEDYRVSPSGILGDHKDPKVGVQWDKVFPSLEKNGCKWYVVECESNPASLDAVKGCIAYMKAHGRA